MIRSLRGGPAAPNSTRPQAANSARHVIATTPYRGALRIGPRRGRIDWTLVSVEQTRKYRETFGSPSRGVSEVTMGRPGGGSLRAAVASRMNGSAAPPHDPPAREALVIDSVPGLVPILTPTGEVDDVNARIIEYCGLPLEAMKH